MKGPEPSIPRSDGLAVVGGGLHLPVLAEAAARTLVERQEAIQRAVPVLGLAVVQMIVLKAEEVSALTKTPWGVVYNSLLNEAMAAKVEAERPTGPNRAERRARTKANAKRVTRVTTASQRDAATAGRSGRALHRKGEIRFFAQTERRKPS